MNGLSYCSVDNSSNQPQCFPHQIFLPPKTTNYANICCCSFAPCIHKINFDDYNSAGALAQLYMMGFGLVFFCIFFALVCKGIKYEWSNIPFYVVQLVYDPPEHVQWVDPWRDMKSRETEENGYFKTRAALEIYVKKKHKKTPDDLVRYWHEHPNEAGGIYIPSWSERIFKNFVGFAVILVLGVVMTPLIFGIFFFKELEEYMDPKTHGGHIFCNSKLADRFVYGSCVIFLSCVCVYYAYKVWKHNNFVLTVNAVVPFSIAIVLMQCIFSLDVLGSSQSIMDQNIHYQSTCLFFFTLDVLLSLFRTYFHNTSALNIDLPMMIKRFRGRHAANDPAPKVWVVSGCPRDDSKMHEANGEYFRSPVVHHEHNIPWSRIVVKKTNNARSKKGSKRTKKSKNGRPQIGTNAEIRFGQGVKRRTMMGKIIRVSKRKKTVSVSFGVELGTSDNAPVYVKLDWSARPGRQPFSFKIMRVATKVLRNQPHWVLVDNRNGQCIGGLGGQVRYAARDLSERVLDEPPSSGWHSLSENPENQGVPSILAWDVADYSINKKGEELNKATTSKNLRIISILYFLWLLVLGTFFFVNISSECLSDGLKDRLLLPILVLFWVEMAVTLMAGVGLKFSPLRISFFQILVRILLTYFSLESWFLAGCIIYIIFSIRVGWYWANETYPEQTVKEILKEELLGALPQWMFSGGGANGDVVDQFIDSTALVDREALFSPLLKLASTFDCLVSNLTGRRQAMGKKSCTYLCTSFFQSALFVLFYFTVTFVGALIHVYYFSYKCSGGST
jgi:hypothetical protein